MEHLTPEQARLLASAAGLEIPDERLQSFAKALARLRALAGELGTLELDDVVPWTPPR